MQLGGTFIGKLDKLFVRVSLIAITILVLGLGQDFIHSSINTYNFYWYESLLFNSFWLLFIPISWVQRTVFYKLQALRLTHTIMSTGLSVLLSIVLHMLTFPLVIFVCSSLFLDHTLSFNHGFNYAISELLYPSLGLYILINLVWRNKKAEHTTAPNYLRQLAVRHKGELKVINTSEIISIQSASPYIKLVTRSGSFLHAQTLKSILAELEPSTFIQVHKSSVVNVNEVIHLKSRLNGDYDITLSDGSIVRLSRNYSSALKARLSKSTA